MVASEKLKAEAVIRRCSVKKLLTNFANQSCFPVNFVKFSKTAFFLRTPLVVASEKLKAEAVVRSYSVRKGVYENFANQRCFPVNFARFS